MGLQKTLTIQNFLLLVCMLLAHALSADVRTDSLPSIFDYLGEHDTLELTVTTDIKSLLKKRDEYQAAKIEFRSGDKEVLFVEGEIRTRGNARKEICYVPPTKLRFDKDFLRKLGFSTYPTIKVVNSCTLSEFNETYVSAERLAYQFNRLFTDVSFRTIPIQILYIDSEGKKKDMAFKAFLIEHEDQLADRSNGKIYEPNLFKEEMLTRESYMLFSMFQYMIGNTDWKVLNKHNLKILRIMDKREIHPIAYDFDYSGFVNTHYSVPHETLPIKTVRDRLYVGMCFTEEELPRYTALFLEKREAIMQMVEQSELPEKTRKSCTLYLEDFYKTISNERTARATFVKCHNAN